MVALVRPRDLLCGREGDLQEDTFNLSLCRAHLKTRKLWELTSMYSQELLNISEVERLHTYVDKWNRLTDPTKCEFEDLVVHLGDNPTTDKGWTTWSAKSHAIPTLRKSGGILFSPFAGRQLLLKELYAAMGFASFPHLAAAARVPLYPVFKPMLNLRYSHMKQALGNAQHVGNVGVFTAVALASSSLL